jgi:LPS-assembly lipoprotein
MKPEIKVYPGRSRSMLALLGLAMTGLVVSGCGFQPLYGTTSTGVQLSDVMRRVTVAPIPGRVGQRIRNELIYSTTGGGDASYSDYRLEIAIRESVKDVFVTQKGQSEGRSYEIIAAFKLVRISDDAVLISGNSLGRAAFDNLESIFADVRARRDAENRAAKTVATDIQTRIAAVLSQQV